MQALFHRWLLVYLYHLATWLHHEAQRLQRVIRRALLPYASRSYNQRWPLTAKPVIPWQQRLTYAQAIGKPISPVKHRKEIPSTIHCPNCGAPREYLYNFGYEQGHSGCQDYHKVLCKICGFQTAPERQKRSPQFFCPYCKRSLERIKKRRSFDLFKCRNKKCPYRRNESLRKEAQKYGANEKAKAYIFRSFKMELDELQLTQPRKPKVDFARIRHSTTAVTLAITFHIHLGLSLRETAFWLRQIFMLPISHQTVANWCQSVAYLLSPLIQQHIEDAQFVVGDETFITISGKDAYWWITYNPDTATIVAQLVSINRDTTAATTIIKQTKEQVPEMTHFISDAWDAYALALLYLGQQQESVPEHIVVKGLQYRDAPSDAFLWHKVLIERFFRTFKQRYRRTLGFDNFNGAVTFCVLFTVYYNFFRPHTRINSQPPIQQFEQDNVLSNWQQLVKYAIENAA